MYCGAGMARLIIVAIYFILFCVLSPSESEDTVGLVYAKKAIISPIN